MFSHLLLRSDKPLHSDRGQNTDRETGRQRSRSRSRSRDRDGEANPKRKRKRPSRWSDRPPSPRRDDDNKKDDRDFDRCRDRLVDRPPPEEPVVGDIYNGKISSIMQFGCFVQLEGLRSAYSALIFSFSGFRCCLFVLLSLEYFSSPCHGTIRHLN